jgi:hypothetical protein
MQWPSEITITKKQDGVPLIGEDRSGADEKIAVLTHIKLGELR